MSKTCWIPQFWIDDGEEFHLLWPGHDSMEINFGNWVWIELESEGRIGQISDSTLLERVHSLAGGLSCCWGLILNPQRWLIEHFWNHKGGLLNIFESTKVDYWTFLNPQRWTIEHVPKVRNSQLFWHDAASNLKSVHKSNISFERSQRRLFKIIWLILTDVEYNQGEIEAG